MTFPPLSRLKGEAIVEKIVLLALATWRLTALLCYDDLFMWLRELAGVYITDKYGTPEKLAGRVLSCFWCTSLISAVITVLLWYIKAEIVLYLLAASGGAIILHHWTRIVRDVMNK